MHRSVGSHRSMWWGTEPRTWWSKVVRPGMTWSQKLMRPVRTRRTAMWRRTIGATGSIGTWTEGEGRTRGAGSARRRLTSEMTRRTTVRGRVGHAGPAGTESIELWGTRPELRAAHRTLARHGAAVGGGR